jgi:sulfate/thiosulfate transport system substrate-binding protein
MTEKYVNGRMKRLFSSFLVFLLIPLYYNCGNGKGKDGSSSLRADVLVLAAYSVPKEVYRKEIIPAFKKYWKEKTGRKASFKESYMASGAQARAIVSGMEADVAALSLETDMEKLVKKGLIRHDWKKDKFGGFVTRSVAVIAYRPGNPKGIRGWDDLKRTDIKVIYPSPRTSGGAMWIVNAIYGAGLKITEEKYGAPDKSFAVNMLKNIQSRVKVMDKSARASATTFENGFGDVLLTYENEAVLRQKQGKDFPYIVPEATILIENPIAVVDRNVDKHGSREVAEAFVEFVRSVQAQRFFSDFGFRSVDDEVLRAYEAEYPVPRLLFDISYLGGWTSSAAELYGPKGVWTGIMRDLASGR